MNVEINGVVGEWDISDIRYFLKLHRKEIDKLIIILK